MARMLPPTLPDHVKSGAEKTLFARMQRELSDDWIVIHSLGLTIHDRKPWAEVDFVLIGPTGIYCLEAKGGRITRTDGVWYTTPLRGPRAGRRSPLDESPFEQVGTASAKLYVYLKQQVPNFPQTIVGYAVATPDCEWSISGPDQDRALVYDQRDALSPFGGFLQRVSSRWDEQIGRGWGRKIESLSEAARERIAEAMRGDFDLVPSLHVTAQLSNRELIRLTEEQSGLFSRLAHNPRVLARGAAGTGKTVIAAEEARRLTAEGRTVLFTCFSRNLAHHLQAVLGSDDSPMIRTFHSLMTEIVDNAGLRQRLPDAQPTDLFENFYPDLCLEILLNEPTRRFDAVIVDEGQDLLLDAYVDVIDALLEGGIRDGTWRWFIDPQQNIFSATAPQGLERILAAHPVDWPLTVNCRNTAPIATQVSLLTGVDSDATLTPDGPNVEYEWSEGPTDQRRKVSKRLRRLLNEGFAAEEITILSRYRLENSCLADGLAGPGPAIRDVSRGGIDTPAAGVRFSTIASFKGLESDVVLLVDVDDLTHRDVLSLMYVGSSRARVVLAVFLYEGLRARFGELAEQFGRRFAATTGDCGGPVAVSATERLLRPDC